MITFSLVKRTLRVMLYQMVYSFATIIIEGIYGGVWKYRETVKNDGLKAKLYSHYLLKYSCFIGLGAQFKDIPILPHGFNGIHISNKAIIGRGVTIFQQVTIGSNSLIDHPRNGSPTIGNNVYIGAGAKIIGKVNIGDNCRIGANAVVVKDMLPNTTAVSSPTRFITNESGLNNDFVPVR